MKNKFMCALLFIASVQGFSQTRVCEIPLMSVVPQQSVDVPQAAKSQLASRLKTMSAKQGFGSSNELAQFYVYPEINIVSQEVMAGTPRKYIVELEVSFFVEDGYDRKIFTSTSITTKGLGTSQSKAFLQAIQGISNQSPELIEFFNQANSLISNYYSSNYQNIIKRANTLAQKGEYQDAIYLLTVIPECTQGYESAIEAVGPIYQLYVDREASAIYQRAVGVWNASQDEYGARQASEILSQISSESSSYGKCMALLNEIKAKIKENQDLELEKYYQEIERKEKRYQDEQAHKRFLANNYKEISLGIAKSIAQIYK